MNQTIFVYAYVPSVPRDPSDGGFSVNLSENDTLTFLRFDTSQNVIQELSFAVVPEVRFTYLACIDTARGWLNNMYPVMRVGQGARYTCRVGIDGFPLFLIEDFEELMKCPFGSGRAHYARMMYNLLEDIATGFNKFGFTLTPTSFYWDRNRVQPFEKQHTFRSFKEKA